MRSSQPSVGDWVEAEIGFGNGGIELGRGVVTDVWRDGAFIVRCRLSCHEYADSWCCGPTYKYRPLLNHEVVALKLMGVIDDSLREQYS